MNHLDIRDDLWQHPGSTIHDISQRLGTTYHYTAELLTRARYRGLIYRIKDRRKDGDRRRHIWFPTQW